MCTELEIDHLNEDRILDSALRFSPPSEIGFRMSYLKCFILSCGATVQDQHEGASTNFISISSSFSFSFSLITFSITIIIVIIIVVTFIIIIIIFAIFCIITFHIIFYVHSKLHNHFYFYCALPARRYFFLNFCICYLSSTFHILMNYSCSFCTLCVPY